MALRRAEAIALLAAGLLMVVAGVVWLFGAYGLMGSGVLVLVLTLFVFDVRPDAGGERRAEPVDNPAPPVARR